MDTQEIPILTEVFKAKAVKTQPDVVEVTPEVRQMISAHEPRPVITQEVITARSSRSLRRNLLVG